MMNLSINNLIFNRPRVSNQTQPQTVAFPRFGLTMASPLSKDTVSFRCNKQTVKKMAKRSDGISIALAKRIRAKKEKPHQRKKQMLIANFGSLIEKGVITFKDRLKGENSICEKSATRGWSNMEECLTHMGDISGFCFIMNTPKAFSETIKQLKQLLQSRDIEVTEAEYHRRESKYKGGKLVESFDSFKPAELSVLKSEIYKIQNPTTQIWKDVDSRSGYSGLHLTLRTKDGEKSELQIMVMTMDKVKKVENLLYKIRNGKTVDPMYDLVEKYLTPLKPIDDYASDSERKEYEMLQAAMTKYTQEAYAGPLEKPFDKNFKLLSVEDAQTLTKKEKALIAKYDLNSIAILMEACEKIAKK